MIEECPLYEEAEEMNTTVTVDYMKCINCSDRDKNSYTNNIDNINYCFGCKHLHQKKKKNILFGVTSASNEGRRSSWDVGDKQDVRWFPKLSASSPSSSRCSLTGSLPTISEPDGDE